MSQPDRVNPWIGLAVFAAFSLVMTLVVIGTIVVFTPPVRKVASNITLQEATIVVVVVGVAILSIKYTHEE